MTNHFDWFLLKAQAMSMCIPFTNFKIKGPWPISCTNENSMFCGINISFNIRYLTSLCMSSMRDDGRAIVWIISIAIYRLQSNVL